MPFCDTKKEASHVECARPALTEKQPNLSGINSLLRFKAGPQKVPAVRYTPHLSFVRSPFGSPDKRFALLGGLSPIRSVRIRICFFSPRGFESAQDTFCRCRLPGDSCLVGHILLLRGSIVAPIFLREPHHADSPTHFMRVNSRICSPVIPLDK